jgi:hypothetical protein
MAEAVESYVKALALDPNFVLALFNLGQAHDRLGNVRTRLRVCALACVCACVLACACSHDCKCA